MFQKIIKKIARGLIVFKIPYMIIGGQAVLIYGEPRMTKDIDVTLGVGIEKLPELRKIIKKLNLKILVKNIDDFVKKTMVLPVIDKGSGIRIDFIFSFSPYERQAIKRVKKVKIENTMVNFASIEDTIIHKIIAGRPRDLEDIKSILLKNKKYNLKYINRNLYVFGKSLGEKYLYRFKKILKEIRNIQ